MRRGGAPPHTFLIMIENGNVTSDGASNPRGWEALEIKLKAKGLSAGEISQARKSFYDGMETLTKMFLSTYSVEKSGSGQ